MSKNQRPRWTTVGPADAFVAKYAGDGTLLSKRLLRSSKDASVSGLALSRGALFAGGTTGGTFPGKQVAGEGDAFLARLAG
jgi:hypothetical protein